MKTTAVPCNTSGVRLDIFLASSVEQLSRSAAAKLIEAGRVTSGSVILRKNHKTEPGSIYLITQDEPEVSSQAGQDIRLDIIFEDDDIIVVNKPRGMVVHPAPGHADGTLVNALLYHCGGSLSGIGGVLRPGIVHRIDKDTSGLLIAAKNDKAHISLSSQLSSRSLKREYNALVCGAVKNTAGTVDVPVGRHPKDRKKQAAGNLPGARAAVTHFEVIARYDGYTHIKCSLETGRTHQIRVHMAHIGHPLLGDTVYGYKPKAHKIKLEGQCLHAGLLRFVHPSSGESIELSSPLPGYFTDVLEKLKGTYYDKS